MKNKVVNETSKILFAVTYHLLAEHICGGEVQDDSQQWLHCKLKEAAVKTME